MDWYEQQKNEKQKNRHAYNRFLFIHVFGRQEQIGQHHKKPDPGVAFQLQIQLAAADYHNYRKGPKSQQASFWNTILYLSHKTGWVIFESSFQKILPTQDIKENSWRSTNTMVHKSLY